jgi:Tfp pilus assembly protein PilF
MNQFQEAEDRFKAGLHAKQHGDLARAGEEFKAAISLNPSHAQACSEWGAIEYSQGRFEAATGLLRQAIDLDPDQGHAQLFLALTLGELRDNDAAESHFQKALLIGEMPAVTYAAYGNFLGALKRPDAEQAFQSALERDPDCVLAIRDYARLLASLDRGAEAEDLFRKALQIDPDNAATNLRYGRFLRSLDGRWKEAVTHLRRALELDPGLDEARDVLDDLAEEQGLPD